MSRSVADILMPPEWAPQDWLWIGFPHLAEEWPGYLDAAQKQIMWTLLSSAEFLMNH